MNNNSKTKKLIVPAVALILCVMAMVGTGYAFSSSVSNVGNSMNVEYDQVSIYDAGWNEVTSPLFDDQVNLEFGVDKVPGSNGKYETYYSFNSVTKVTDGSKYLKAAKYINGQSTPSASEYTLMCLTTVYGTKDIVEEVKIVLTDKNGESITIRTIQTAADLVTIKGNTQYTIDIFVYTEGTVSSQNYVTPSFDFKFTIEEKVPAGTTQ